MALFESKIDVTTSETSELIGLAIILSIWQLHIGGALGLLTKGRDVTVRVQRVLWPVAWLVLLDAACGDDKMIASNHAWEQRRIHAALILACNLVMSSELGLVAKDATIHNIAWINLNLIVDLFNWSRRRICTRSKLLNSPTAHHGWMKFAIPCALFISSKFVHF